MLNHPKRSEASPLLKLVVAINGELSTVAAQWSMTDLLDAQAFVTSTTNMANQFMVVVAALNTVMNFKASVRGQKQASIGGSQARREARELDQNR